MAIHSVLSGQHQNGTNTYTNGKQHSNGDDETLPSRADELNSLLTSVLSQIIPFVQQADSERDAFQRHDQQATSSLVESHTHAELSAILTSKGTLSLPEHGTGASGLQSSVSSILKYSVNTSSPGFLDKLYSAPLPPGVAAELILAVLNTNVHVYQVSPVLTLAETHVARTLASKFGFTGPRAGGISVQGGSASNLTSIVIARNNLFPETKRLGNHAGGRELVLFTSEHGHYSIEKAAQQCGFGSESVISVPVDPASGQMDPKALEALVVREKKQGRTPFYVNATAGTTVLGSFDPFEAIADVARRHGLWMHIDGAWGGSFVFSETLRERSLKGAHLADSIAINPHKMLGVPVTCSFLLLKDLRHAHTANTLRAGYLFHDREDDDDNEDDKQKEKTTPINDDDGDDEAEKWTPPIDLADMTLQCGRRGDALKLLLSWQYYGTSGYARKIDDAYGLARHLADLVDRHDDLILVSNNPPPCLQVCFYFAPRGKMVYDLGSDTTPGTEKEKEKVKVGKRNSTLTSRITHALIQRGFMVDFAPALADSLERGSFFRVVVNVSTTRHTVERLVEEVVAVGLEVVAAAVKK